MNHDTHANFTAPSPLTGEVGSWRKQIADLIAAAEKQAAQAVLECLAFNAKDDSIFVRVPAGEFEMGDGKDSNCPKHMVYLSEYWIGLYCVTNRQYWRFVQETKHPDPDPDQDSWSVWKNGRCPDSKLDDPVVCLSWDDCAAYAKWAGLSLPTEAQWEHAARGPSGLIYPWGNEWDQGKCRNDKNRSYGQTSAVWDFPAGASGYGTIQQSGNVWEWCADWYDVDYYGKSPAKDPGCLRGGPRRVCRGGSWGSDATLLFRGANRASINPDRCARGRGFRLVRNCIVLNEGRP